MESMRSQVKQDGPGGTQLWKGFYFDAFFFRVLLEDLEENVLNNRKKNVLVNLFFFFSSF